MGIKDRVAGAFDSTWTQPWRILNGVIFIGIAASVTATVLETVPELDRAYGPTFDAIEKLSAWLFAAEMIARVWCSNSPLSRYGHRRHPRLSYVFSTVGIIDLLAVLPYFLGWTNFMVVRSLRLIRIFRLLKLTRQARAMQLIGEAFKIRRYELASLAMIVGLALLISATLMYSAEHVAQPTHFGSIPQSLWWSVATLTSVGTADYHPVTLIGRTCSAAIMLACVALVSLPTGILGSAMYELLTTRGCPKCGARLDHGRAILPTQHPAEPDQPKELR